MTDAANEVRREPSAAARSPYGSFGRGGVGTLAPVTRQLVTEGLWRRPGLGVRDRRLVTIALAAMHGTFDVAEVHVAAALESDELSVDELGELCVHVAFYGGWPVGNTLQRLVVRRAGEMGRDSGGAALAPTDTGIVTRGGALPSPYGAHGGSHGDAMADVTRAVVTEGLWRRPNLSWRDRRLVTIAIAAKLGAYDVAEVHVGAALEYGELSVDELTELSIQIAFYGGWPVGNKLQRVVRTRAAAHTAASAPTQ